MENDKSQKMKVFGANINRFKIEEFYDFLINLNIFLVFNFQLYMHQPVDNYWLLLKFPEAKQRICELISPHLLGKISSSTIDEVIKRLIQTPYLQYNFAADIYQSYIKVKNGIYDIASKKIIAINDNQIKFPYCLNFTYLDNVKIQSAPTFHSFVTSSLGKGSWTDSCSLLMEILGYIISDIQVAKKAFFLIGEPNSGKSLVLELIKDVVTERFSTAVPFNKLGERFNKAKLLNSKINICTELDSGKMKNLDIFKSITSNEYIMAEFKGENCFEFRVKTKLISAGNVMPRISELDGVNAILNRFIILRFPHSIVPEKIDYELLGKLLKEKDIIFSNAINSLKELKNSNFLFTIPEDSKVYLHEYQRNGNSLKDFIEDLCELNPKDRIHIKTLWEKYLEYCEENCCNLQIDIQQFTQYISRLNGVEKTKFRLNGSNPLWGFSGIGLKE